MQAHWNNVYGSKPVNLLGWYEPQPEPSFTMIERCGIRLEEGIIDAGSGASTIIRALLERGYNNITAVDISAEALNQAREQLGVELAARVKWVVEDLTRPAALTGLAGATLWHDRAVLHFFTSEEQRQNYKSTLQRVLRPGGYAVIAAFAVGGATQCSGLPVHNYDLESLQAFLGSAFQLIESCNILYQMPSGATRPYIYTLFQML